MQQRQLRLGDILDDYCPRERRLTNHVVVAMIGDDVKQTRCTTCDADHEYKHARVPRPRKKSEAAILSPMATVAPKKVIHDSPQGENDGTPAVNHHEPSPETERVDAVSAPSDAEAAEQEPIEETIEPTADEGPVHRPLIRAQLPRIEGQP